MTANNDALLSLRELTKFVNDQTDAQDDSVTAMLQRADAAILALSADRGEAVLSELIAAAKEVHRISARDHEAWHRLEAAIAASPGEAQREAVAWVVHTPYGDGYNFASRKIMEDMADWLSPSLTGDGATIAAWQVRSADGDWWMASFDALDRYRAEGIETRPLYASSAAAVLDGGSLREQANSWEAVFNVLNEVAPGWTAHHERGVDCAVEAIKRLAAGSAQSQEPELWMLDKMGYRIYCRTREEARPWDDDPSYTLTPLYAATPPSPADTWFGPDFSGGWYVKHGDLFFYARPQKIASMAEFLESAGLPSPAESAEGDLPARDPAKSNTEQGLYRKFDVRRTDGSDAPGGKHYGCDYFVLDVTHDKLAKPALSAYAEAAAATHPDLARNMRERYGITAAAPSGVSDAAMAHALQWHRELANVREIPEAIEHLPAIEEAIAAYDPATAGARTSAAPSQVSDAMLVPMALIPAVCRLVIAGRTSGGTAGRDEVLCAALDEVESLLVGATQPQPGRVEGMVDGEELLRLIGGVGGWTNPAGDKLVLHSSVLQLIRRRVIESKVAAPTVGGQEADHG